MAAKEIGKDKIGRSCNKNYCTGSFAITIGQMRTVGNMHAKQPSFKNDVYKLLL